MQIQDFSTQYTTEKPLTKPEAKWGKIAEPLAASLIFILPVLILFLLSI